MPYDPFDDVEVRPQPTATPAWYVTNSENGTYFGPFRRARDAAENIIEVCDLVPGEKIEWLPARATCQAGHPLLVTTKGTFWLTVEDDGVPKVAFAVVMADEGDAGQLSPTTSVFGCTDKDCVAEIDDRAAELAKAAVLEPAWPLLHHGDHSFIRMEG